MELISQLLQLKNDIFGNDRCCIPSGAAVDNIVAVSVISLPILSQDISSKYSNFTLTSLIVTPSAALLPP